MRYLIWQWMSLLLIWGCPSSPDMDSKEKDMRTIDIEGHRGCRGLMPENTLPAFQKALELGVTTLELDLAVSKDKQLIVSHEPYFRAGLSIDPAGVPITPENQLDHNIYQMTVDEIKAYDVGTIADPRYPERENIKTYKPVLSEVVYKAQHYAFAFEKEVPQFNIEIKRKPEYDGIYHPTAQEFVDLVLRDIKDLDIYDQTIIQSFDIETLRLVRSKDAGVRTALLVENQEGAAANITKLGYKPTIYSCYFKLLDQQTIDYCHRQGILVVPWTVNEVADMQELLDQGVDGIITDYPDRLLTIAKAQ